MKKYSRKQIIEAIRYWEHRLSRMDEDESPVRIEDVEYVAVKLDDGSKQLLSGLLDDYADELPDLRKRYCDHLTLAYGKEMTQGHMRLVGTQTKLTFDRMAFDGRCACIEIKSGVEQLDCAKKHPHITLAVAPGVKAVYSNTLLDRLESGSSGVKRLPLAETTLDGVVTAYMKDGSRISKW